jgi:rhamnogalacturonan endolyase
MTGEEIDRVPWPEQALSFGDYNRNNRQQMTVAYLDGKTPALLINRGTYRRMVVDAYQLNGNKLEKLWRWDGDEENPVIRSMNAHSITCYDVDNDGRDEIIMGSMVIDDNGEALWSAGLGHPDKAIVGKIIPDREGLQILYSVEEYQDTCGMALVDARTGEYIWTINQYTQHVGSGFAVDIDPAYPGLECFGAEDSKAGKQDRYMFTANGDKIGVDEDVPGDRNWFWWDSGLLRATSGMAADTPAAPAANQSSASATNRGVVRREMPINLYKGKTLDGGTIQGAVIMVADIKGDWREEIITSLPGEIRIYSTPIPAVDKRICLMQDPLYRSCITSRSMGYDQPAMVSYYLGVDPAEAHKYQSLIKKTRVR